MFFWMSKLLVPLSEPLTYIVGLMLAALIGHQRPLLVKVCLGLALGLLMVVGTPFVPYVLLRSLETRYQVPASLPAVDAVIVLTGMVNLRKSSEHSIEFNESVDRILAGIRLIKAGQGKFLIITGGSGDIYDQTRREAPFLRQFAIDFGVPVEQILIDPESRNTYENAVYTKTLMEQHGLSSSILVTSASHLPRSMGCFQKIGVHPVPYPVDFRASPRFEFQILDLIPGDGSLHTTSIVLHEYLGMLSYKLAGYI